MVVDGETYSFVKASDVIRDGVALECWRRYGKEDSAMVAEAFWHDETGKFTIRMLEGELPLVWSRHFFERPHGGAHRQCAGTSAPDG